MMAPCTRNGLPSTQPVTDGLTMLSPKSQIDGMYIVALPSTIDYKDLMEKLVCSLESINCMIHRCEKYTSRLNLANFLEVLLENAD